MENVDKDRQIIDQNDTHKNNKLKEINSQEYESDPTKRENNVNDLPDSPESEYRCANNSEEVKPNYYLQNQFEVSLHDIQTAELKVKNGLPYKPSIDEPGPSTSASDKKGKERSHCPLYYGIKSYIHDFYCPPDKEVFKSGEYMQGDDFRFLAEPRRKKNLWFNISWWIGINLSVLGIIALLMGYLTPQRPTIVAEFQGYFIVDRWATIFNNRLVLCQLSGLAVLLCGIVIIICSLLLSNCQPKQSPTYYVMGATVLPESFVGTPFADPQAWGIHRIPLTGTIKSVQPSFIRSQY